MFFCIFGLHKVVQPYYLPAKSFSSSQTTRHPDWTSGLVVSYEEDENEYHMCGTQDGAPQSVGNIPLTAIFLPLFLLLGAGVLLIVSKLVEKKIIPLLSSKSNLGRCISICSRAHDCFALLHHG
ncbi:hypothetical protein EJ110_NYTH56207 [Nymphaea thermarum]|nr:hypothetical protein EJ110_NYTH56207 [Nymphaea thermarum]